MPILKSLTDAAKNVFAVRSREKSANVVFDGMDEKNLHSPNSNSPNDCHFCVFTETGPGMIERTPCVTSNPKVIMQLVHMKAGDTFLIRRAEEDATSPGNARVHVIEPTGGTARRLITIPGHP
jgi:hypothetical protein